MATTSRNVAEKSRTSVASNIDENRWRCVGLFRWWRQYLSLEIVSRGKTFRFLRRFSFWKTKKKIRKIRSVGVWPVGLVGELLYERPICVDGKVKRKVRSIDWRRNSILFRFIRGFILFIENENFQRIYRVSHCISVWFISIRILFSMLVNEVLDNKNHKY